MLQCGDAIVGSLRHFGINMADDASETFGGGVRNYLGALGFILPLVGLEELIRSYVSEQSALPHWVSIVLIVAGLPIYVAPAAWKKFRGVRQTADSLPLGYLRGEDSELGGAIRDMVWCSAWGKWYTAQSLANSAPKPVNEQFIMGTATSIVLDALTDGRLEVRGRKPGQMDFEPIPQTHWRSTGLHMVRDDRTLWKMILVPRGVAEIHPDGKVVGRDQSAVQRTDQLAAYDSLIVNARQFEKLWPLKHKDTDAKRKALLKKAKKAGADPAEIAKLARD
jgi:hypothetical protein